MERLFRGSVINPNTFFQEDYISGCQMREAPGTGSNTTVLEFPYDKMEELCEKYPCMKEALNKYRLQCAKWRLIIPLDYIAVHPQEVVNKLVKRSQKTLELKEIQSRFLQSFGEPVHRKSRSIDKTNILMATEDNLILDEAILP